MNDKLIEFWSQFFLNAFKNKQKVGDLFSWMQQGMSGHSFSDPQKLTDFKGLMEMFRKMYGIEQLSAQSDDYQKLTAKAAKDFQQSFKDFMSLVGMVPIQEYLTLIRKYEKLKEKCQDQEETIRHLKLLVDDKKEPADAKNADLHQLVKNQGDVFLKMLKDFGSMVNDEKPAESQPDSVEIHDQNKAGQTDQRGGSD